MKHEWMRQKTVDIDQYLPKFLPKSDQFKSTDAADSKEHETIRIDLQDVLDQFYVKSATWGLERWEELVGITTDEKVDTDARRQAILAKLQNPESVTLEFMTNLINRYIADRQGFIITHYDEYRIEILYHGGQVTDYAQLRKDINTYIPAHIGYKLITYTIGQLFFHGAGTVQCYRKNIIGMSVNYSVNVDDTTMHIAGRIIHNYKQMFISGGGQ